MSRPIKFRAWVKPGGRFREGMHDWQSIIDTIDLESGFEKSLLRFGTDPEYADRVTLMQYTGLHDKNGVEIYEGDIVISNPKRYLDKPTVVEWSGDPTWDSDGTFAMWSGYWHSYAKPEEVEVIGNIWQNPDLLAPSPTDHSSDKTE